MRNSFYRFIDASSYVAVLNPYDSLHKRALELSALIFTEGNKIITSYAVLGEVLTVGSMRYNRQASVDCYSFAIIDHYKIGKVFSFDRDFKKYTKAKFLEPTLPFFRLSTKTTMN